MVRMIVAAVGAMLAAVFSGCLPDGPPRGPTCCSCLSIDYSTGCLKSGKVEEPTGFEDCETACTEAGYRGCGETSSEECGASQVADPSDARAAFQAICRDGAAPICTWPSINGELISQSGSCIWDGTLQTCLLNGTLHLFDNGCIASAPLESEGSFRASCTTAQDSQSSNALVESYSYEGTLVDDVLTTRRVFEQHALVNGQVVDPCSSIRDFVLTDPTCT